MACAAHCRWCLREQYPISCCATRTSSVRQVLRQPRARDSLREVLVTGGDPFQPQRLQSSPS
jgi:L-lysine 2,3-aminomutase